LGLYVNGVLQQRRDLIPSWLAGGPLAVGHGKWGARRAADGHAAPYNVRFVKIGNEDQFDRSGSYPQRYAASFYDAIKAAHPELKLLATLRVTNRPMNVVDDHYYNSDPGFFAGAAGTYDTASRDGPKVLVGEFASTEGSTTGTLAAALGEACRRQRQPVHSGHSERLRDRVPHGGTATVLSGDPAAQNSLAKPTAVSPTSHRLGRLGGTFRYTFAANSLTVLALNISG
jgi:alpha-L-arabinofuranosidase